MIHRQARGPRVWLWPDGTAAGRIDLSPILESCNTSKSLRSPTGQWSIRLQPSLARGSRSIFSAGDFARLIRPNAVVTIGRDRPGGIMVGLVNSVSRQRSWSGAGDTITVSGEDFGKVLVNDAIVRAMATVQDFDQFAAKIEAVAPGTSLTNQLAGVWGPERWDGSNAFVQATVEEVVRWVLSTVTTVRIPMLAGIGGNSRGTIGNFMFGAVVPSWNDGRIQSENLWSYTGSIWSFLNTVIDHEFYEVFVDSYGGANSTLTSAWVTTFMGAEDVPVVSGTLERRTLVGGRAFVSENASRPLPDVALVVRPKPFDEAALSFLDTRETPGLTWEDLRTAISGAQHHVIPADAVISEAMSVNDAQVFSYFNVTSNYDIAGNPIAASEGLFYPAIDLFALQNHGVRPYEASLSLLGSDVYGREVGSREFVANLGSEVLEFRNRLFNWYRLNAWFESGSVTVAEFDAFRVGDPVFLPWKEPMRWPGASRYGANPRGMRYYCTGVQTAWTYGGIHTSTLTLERGHNAALVEAATAQINAAGGGALGMPSMIAALPDTKWFEGPAGGPRPFGGVTDTSKLTTVPSSARVRR